MQQTQQYMDIGRRIQTRRKELRIKQSELAEKLDISNNHMSSIENGRDKPSLDTLICICEELSTTPDYFLLGNMHPNNISQDILDGLRLCSEDDLKLARNFIELLIDRNKSAWNEKHSV